MVEDVTAEAAEARHLVREHLRDLMKALRIFKGHQPPQRSPIPAGMVGVLATIDAMAVEHGSAGPGCHGKDLAARNALDPSTVSRAVAALVRLGLVRRTADPTDGRASHLALTEAGHAALSATTSWYDDLLAAALADWSQHNTLEAAR